MFLPHHKLRSARGLRLLLTAADLLARAGLIARARLASGRSIVERLVAENEALKVEIARVRAEYDLLRERFRKIPARSRPHFSPFARLEILWHGARFKLSFDQMADIFLVTRLTVHRWKEDLKRGVCHLVCSRQPLNTLPQVISDLAIRLKLEQASWGTRRIAATLVRLGAKLSRASVQRILRRPRPSRRPPPPMNGRAYPGICPKRTGHVWATDLTQVSRGFLGAIHIGGVIDMFSRKVLALGGWAHTPTADDVRALLLSAVIRYGSPAWIISDRGTQFTAKRFGRLLKRRRIHRRFGAVASSQSVAIIERFWRSLKREGLCDFYGIRSLTWVRRRLKLYQRWFNTERVHEGLAGATPNDIHWRRRQASPRTLREIRHAELSCSYLGGARAFPVYRLQASA